MSKSNINVLHVFDKYPGSNTQNWIFNTIANTPNIDVYIAAEQYTKHNLYSNKFKYFLNPIESLFFFERSLSKNWNTIFRKLFYFLILKLLGSYKYFLNKQIQNSVIDIAHIHFANIGCEYYSLIKQNKIPIIVSFYGYDYEYLPYTNSKYISEYKKLFMDVDIIVCEGNNGAKILKKMGCPEEKIAVLPLGVVIDRTPYKIKTKKTNTLKLIQIASFREKKGHIYSIQAFHRALQTCPDMHFTIVGSGSSKIRDELTGFIFDHNLEKEITIIDEIDYNLLYTFLDAFDVFIHPSCYSSDKDCEGGAPIVLLDAQLLGIPVISTRHCDIPDEVVHNQTGILTEEKDVNGLSEAISTFYKMDGLEFEQYSKSARWHVEKNYNIKINARRLHKLYSELVSKI